MMAHENPQRSAESEERIEIKPRTTFRGRPMPILGRLAGYSALMERYELAVPPHHEMVAVSPRKHPPQRRWLDHAPVKPAAVGCDGRPSHLRPQIRRRPAAHAQEGLSDVRSDLERAARDRPTSAYLRRLCHLYEWLTSERLNVPDVSAGIYVDLVDARQQYGTATSERVRRFRIKHNLISSSAFCPVVFRTRRIDAYIAAELSQRARGIVDSASRELIARAAAFLLLSDLKASFAIEGETPPKDRLTRWGAAIVRAGSWHFDLESLIQLQRRLIGDDRFVRLGLRSEGAFVGRHDSMSQPVPEHISARAVDLVDLLQGLVAFAERSKAQGLHPVLAEGLRRFWLRLHPSIRGRQRAHPSFLDASRAGRPRVHAGRDRLPDLQRHLDDIVGYRNVLEGVSRPLLELIEWTATAKGNVKVLSDTSDYYRYFDATAHCEFLFKCIERSIDRDLPDELAFLEHRDAFHRRVTELVDMSERTLDLLLRFLKQEHGLLSKRARTNEFAALESDEVQQIEDIYAELFRPRGASGRDIS